MTATTTPTTPNTTYVSDEQRAIVESDARMMLINGAAGSCKTATLCMLCKRYFAEGKNVLILTLVGSVTNEIKERIERDVGVKFVQQGNHFINEDGPTHIEIANYDAALHKQLSVHKDPFLRNYGDCFEQKAQLMYEKYVQTGKHRHFVMNNGQVADVLMMDEAQDLAPRKVRILTEILNNHGDMVGIAAGDYMQTIFDHAFEEGEGHPMDIWREELDATYYPMSRCFRCPKAHVDFINALLDPYRAASPVRAESDGDDDPAAKPTTSLPDDAAGAAPEPHRTFRVPPMAPTNDDELHRPVLFACPPAAMNHSSDIVAHQVARCIERLREAEPTLVPADVAIIMAKSNRNAVFRQLEHRLGRLYAEWGFADAVKVFETKGDGFMRPINWAKAVGKTVMLSVHGDKGKGHRVVFFLGLTEGTVPSRTRLYTEKELIDLSLLNVALTRSTRWLFVGFTREFPSRYLRNVKDELGRYAALSWDPITYDGTVFEPMLTEMNRCI